MFLCHHLVVVRQAVKSDIVLTCQKLAMLPCVLQELGEGEDLLGRIGEPADSKYLPGKMSVKNSLDN